MKPDRPSKNLITTLPRTASQTTTSAICRVRSLPSMLPMNSGSSRPAARSRPGSGRRPCPSPRRSRAAPPAAGPRPDALREDGAHAGELGEVLGGRIRVGPDVEEDERPNRADHLDRERGRSTPRRRPRRRTAAAMPAPVWPAVTTASASPLHEVGGDEDRGALLLAQGESRVLVHPDDLRRVDDAHVGGRGGEAFDDAVVADEEDRVLGVRAGVGDGARDDLGGPWSPPIASTATRTPTARRRRGGGARRPGGLGIVAVAHETVTRTPRPPTSCRPA